MHSRNFDDMEVSESRKEGEVEPLPMSNMANAMAKFPRPGPRIKEKHGGREVRAKKGG